MSENTTLHRLHTEANVSNPEEAMFIAINAVAFDMGFLSQKEDNTLLHDWRKGHYFVSELKHGSCEDMRCRLLYVPVFPYSSAVYGFVNEEEVVNFQVNAKEFIAEGIDLTTSDVSDTYNDIETLLNMIKENILLPLLALAQQTDGLTPTFGFMNLAEELKVHILDYLEVQELLAVSATNHHLYDLAQLEVLWERLFKTDFRDSEETASDSKSWKSLYKEKYHQRLSRLRLMRNIRTRMVVPPPLDPRLHIPGPPPPFFGPGPNIFPRHIGVNHDPSIAAAFPQLIRGQRPSQPVPRFSGPSPRFPGVHYRM